MIQNNGGGFDQKMEEKRTFKSFFVKKENPSKTIN